MWTSKWGGFLRHAFADALVDAVDRSNAWCDEWPRDASFGSHDLVLACGDSGGPAWRGDEVVGVVHGEKCVFAFQRKTHLWVHLPALAGWLREVGAVP